MKYCFFYEGSLLAFQHFSISAYLFGFSSLEKYGITHISTFQPFSISTFPHFNMSAIQHFSILLFYHISMLKVKHFSISAFQHFSSSAFQHYSISAFQHVSTSAFHYSCLVSHPQRKIRSLRHPYNRPNNQTIDQTTNHTNIVALQIFPSIDRLGESGNLKFSNKGGEFCV